MADIIQLLPDSIANQIAAGEVIQRPASVIKELVENAIDAGGKNIKIFVKDAGKTLIQVIDDGCGMSETDARMCFERHATSKIRKSADLFSITTMGFRGEAMASIASIAHIELKTRTQNQELGTSIMIEGSKVVEQSACSCPVGSVISVKNLFYNVPARRKFLKKDKVEMKHILDEFQRIALAHPEIFFSLTHNNLEIYHLHAGNTRKRVVGILGSNSNKKLVPISEETDFVKFSGYVCKPELVTKKRGDQFFFVNNRFIKSGYLHHAVMAAYENILAKDTYPLYVIFIEIDPKRIDINVHPTKQEIKFEDERLLYNYLKVCVKQGIGQFAATPSLDFNPELSLSPFKTIANPGLSSSRNTESETTVGSKFNNDYRIKPNQSPNEADNLKNWESLYSGLNHMKNESNPTSDSPITPEKNNNILTFDSQWTDETNLNSENKKPPYQIHNRYIISMIKSGYLLIDQESAHERILYDRYMKMFNNQKYPIQKELFPKKITLSTSDTILLQAILGEIRDLGFDIEFTGQNNFIMNGMPADISSLRNEEEIVDQLLEQFKNNRELKINTQENIARSLAKSACIKKGNSLTVTEMKELIDNLFACSIPQKSPSGKSCYLTYNLDDLAVMFKK